jgi:hypothetical protein
MWEVDMAQTNGAEHVLSAATMKRPGLIDGERKKERKELRRFRVKRPKGR